MEQLFNDTVQVYRSLESVALINPISTLSVIIATFISFGLIGMTRIQKAQVLANLSIKILLAFVLSPFVYYVLTFVFEQLQSGAYYTLAILSLFTIGVWFTLKGNK
jgi:hypothetical protein